MLCLCLALLSNAQDGAADRSALLQRSAAVRARMLTDSMPMTAVQLDTLQAMAARSHGPAVTRLLQQALVISDSIQDLTRERDVLAALAANYERTGHSGEALQATHAVHFLNDSLTSLAHTQALEELRAQQESERQQWEAKNAAQEKVLQAQHDELTHLRHRQQQTYGVAGALVLILMIVMGLVLFRGGRRNRNGNGQVADEQVAAVMPLRKNTLRPPEAVAEAVTDPTIIPVRPVPDADDMVLLSLFHKRMPERLQALKEARSRGDQEKVLRVITSIRPQLIHHDEARFTERCARLIAAGQAVLEETSRTDLDGLIADVELALGAPFSEK